VKLFPGGTRSRSQHLHPLSVDARSDMDSESRPLARKPAQKYSCQSYQYVVRYVVYDITLRAESILVKSILLDSDGFSI
jgi:hypothetical protein